MKAALLFGLNDLRLISGPDPTPSAREIVVRVLACGVCQTDLRKFDTLDGGKLTLPMNLGHEFVGEVLAVGSDVTNIVPGMRVVGDGYLGYADLARMKLDMEPPLHLPDPVLIPPELSDELATFVEPLADCIHALEDQARIRDGERVAVIGAGTMGCLIILAAAQAAGEVVAFEPLSYRRGIATAMGADLAVEALTDGAGFVARFDVVVLTVGMGALVQPALDLLAKAGRLLLFGGFPPGTEIAVDVHRLHYDELSLVGTEWVGVGKTANPQRAYRGAIDLLCRNKSRVALLVSETYVLEDIATAFDRARSDETLKVIVKPTLRSKQ
jgi:L-iditol 2-dehydrogenase